jgi:hypothetical protein
MTGEENAVSIGLLEKALGEEPAFRTGERVRISVRCPIGHFRVSNYIRGKRGWIESVIEPGSAPQTSGSTPARQNCVHPQTHLVAFPKAPPHLGTHSG